MAKILITGGSGFIGTNLIELFENKGYRFVNFDKSSPINTKQEKYWIKGDLLDIASIRNVFIDYRPSIVIHLAARTDCDSDDIGDYIDNTVGTQNLLDVIKDSDSIERVVIASTQYVYKSNIYPFPQNSIDYSPYTAYGESKMIAEKLTHAANLKCAWTIIRPTHVWGPWHMRYPNELWKMIAKGYYVHPGFKEVIRTYAYVKNVTHQIDGILNASASIIDRSVFYLGDLPIDSYKWLNALSFEIRKKEIKRIPIVIFVSFSFIGTILRRFGVSFPLYNTRFKNMVEDYYAPSNITIGLFGVRNSSLKDNTKETVEWLCNAGADIFDYWKDRKSNVIV